MRSLSIFEWKKALPGDMDEQKAQRSRVSEGMCNSHTRTVVVVGLSEDEYCVVPQCIISATVYHIFSKVEVRAKPRIENCGECSSLSFPSNIKPSPHTPVRSSPYSFPKLKHSAIMADTASVNAPPAAAAPEKTSEAAPVETIIPTNITDSYDTFDLMGLREELLVRFAG